MVANDNTPADNPTTDAGSQLGRVLFYEKKLSKGGTVSCSSCHDQAAGFSDPNRLSIGHTGETTRRHSMGLGNARFYQNGKFFWDERANTLEEQVRRAAEKIANDFRGVPEIEELATVATEPTG